MFSVLAPPHTHNATALHNFLYEMTLVLETNDRDGSVKMLQLLVLLFSRGKLH